MAKAREKRRYTATAPGVSVLADVEALSRNLRWTWDANAQRVFAGLDPLLWRATGHHPRLTLAGLSMERRSQLAADTRFGAMVRQCRDDLDRYLRSTTWFQRQVARKAGNLRVAYFSAEYALHECMQQYSGGLGVLAGDHLKATSDLGVPLVGVGLLYRSGYYKQSLTQDGATVVSYPHYDFEQLPLTDLARTIDVPLGARVVKARIWRADVGRTPLILLDTDIRENPAALRGLTRYLYGGDHETRIQQEILLGMGGAAALHTLGIKPTVYHLNEGHAAFCVLARLRGLARASRGGLEAARETVRQSTVFTTHTPVPAGHDRFDTKLMSKYFAGLMRDLGLSREAFMDLGREHPGDRKEPFCMTVLALRLSARCNGVAELHGHTTRKMWMRAFGASRPEDVPIGHVTNGVHPQTWLAPELEPLYRKYLKPKWVGAGPRDDWWKNAGRIPPAELWAARRMLRRRLVMFVRERLVQQVERRLGSIEERIAAQQALDPNTLTLGFARRFATYKRAPLIFHNVKRLASILNHPQRPVQLVFAGKAHPRDIGGQEFVQLIHKHTQHPHLRGRVVLLEEYDMEVGRMMTSGCDVWLNTPLRPHEASGTSGMKPPLHGGLNCSILDGWWPEGYNGRNGWVIGDQREGRTRAQQDRFDADSLYEVLEREIAPLFYERDGSGLPRAWAERMIESMKSVCGRFSAQRMVGEYVERYYVPSHHGR